MALKIKKDDEVVIISGKDRGKTGRVIKVDPKSERVYVDGLNIVKRHERPRQVGDSQGAAQVGGVIERPGPIHVSNVALVDPKDKRPTRIGIVRENGKRYRVALRSGTRLD
jgi:large subunit ribosomal protein L24